MNERLGIGKVLSGTVTLVLDHLPWLFLLTVAYLALDRAVDWLAFGADVNAFMAVTPNGTLVPFQQSASQLAAFAVQAATVWLVLARNEIAARHAPLALVGVVLLFTAVNSSAFFLRNLLALQLMPGAVVPLAIGLIVGGIAIVYLTLCWWLAPAVAVAEGRGPLAAIKRSFALSKGNRARMFAIWILIVVVNAVPMFALWGLSGYGVPPRTVIPLWSPVGMASLAIQIALTMITGPCIAATYLDLRRIKDGAPEIGVFE